MDVSPRRILLGLRFSSIGLALVATSVVLLASGALFSGVYRYYDEVHFSAIAALTRSIELGFVGLIALGLLTGFVGRCFCLAAPTAATTARARIGLAVIFEVCCLLSAASLIVVMLTVPASQNVYVSWFLFAFLFAYLARVQFLRFAGTLAEQADPSLLPEVTAVQRLFLYVPGGLCAACGARVVGTLISQYSDDGLGEAAGVFLAWLIATVAAVAGVIGVWRWSRILVGLRKALARTGLAEPAHADDPDHAYRERYLRGEGVSEE